MRDDICYRLHVGNFSSPNYLSYIFIGNLQKRQASMRRWTMYHETLAKYAIGAMLEEIEREKEQSDDKE